LMINILQRLVFRFLIVFRLKSNVNLNIWEFSRILLN
jgi:hypothetical protein